MSPPAGPLASTINRNKRSLVLNLADPRGLDLLLALAYTAPDAMQAYTYLGEDATAPAHLAGFLSVRRTADGFMTIFAIADAEFAGLCRALDRPDLVADPRFADSGGRMRNAQVLAELLDAATARRTTAEMCARLEAEDVPHAPANRLATLHEDPQVVENALLVELEHATAGRLRTPRPVARFGATPASLRRPAPGLGEHGAEILDALGVSAAEREVLCDRGVVG